MNQEVVLFDVKEAVVHGVVLLVGIGQITGEVVTVLCVDAAFAAVWAFSGWLSGHVLAVEVEPAGGGGFSHGDRPLRLVERVWGWACPSRLTRSSEGSDRHKLCPCRRT